MGRRTVRDLLRRRAVTDLVALLADGSWREKEAAAKALGEIGDTAAVEPIGACLRHRNRRVRQSAAGALGAIPTERSVKLLEEVITQPYSDVVGGNYSQGHEVFVIGAAARAIGALTRHGLRLSDGTRAELIARLATPALEERQLAAEVMGATGDPAFVPELSRELDRARQQRTKARADFAAEMYPWVLLEALGASGAPSAAQSSADALEDPDPNIREAAARALARIGDQRGPNYFRRVLHDDPGRRWVALSNLADLGDTTTLADVTPFLASDDWTVRREAATAVGRLGDARTPLRLLEPLLDDPQEQVRVAARNGLADLHAKRAEARRVRHRA